MVFTGSKIAVYGWELTSKADILTWVKPDITTLDLHIEEKIHKHKAVFDACVFGARQSDNTQLPALAASHGERTRGLVVPSRRRSVVLSESER